MSPVAVALSVDARDISDNDPMVSMAFARLVHAITNDLPVSPSGWLPHTLNERTPFYSINVGAYRWLARLETHEPVRIAYDTTALPATATVVPAVAGATCHLCGLDHADRLRLLTFLTAEETSAV